MLFAQNVITSCQIEYHPKNHFQLPALRGDVARSLFLFSFFFFGWGGFDDIVSTACFMCIYHLEGVFFVSLQVITRMLGHRIRGLELMVFTFVNKIKTSLPYFKVLPCMV